MKKLYAVLALVAFFTFIYCANMDAPKTVGLQRQNATSDCYFIKGDSVKFCADGTVTSICSKIPFDINTAKPPFFAGYTSFLSPKFQPPFDQYAWQLFTSLNWPVDSTGDLGRKYNGSERVWESYIDADELMGEQIKTRSANKKNTEKFFYMTAKNAELHHLFQIGNQPLIDKNLNFVIYEQKVNPMEADFIKENNLTNKEGIIAYYNKTKKDIVLPAGSIEPGEELSPSIEIKASWRILTEENDTAKYYHRMATIHVPAKNSLSGKPYSVQERVGLVGMHLIAKTKNFNNWIWASFEHEDNLPDKISLEKAHASQSTDWSFYNPKCQSCPVNKPPAYQEGDTISYNPKSKELNAEYRFDTVAPYAKRYAYFAPGESKIPDTLNTWYGTQLLRLYPIYYCTQEMNKKWQEKLTQMNSVFANYKLIGAQWIKQENSRSGLKGADAPFFLANSTMESYKQPISSCIGCHKHAGVHYEENGKNKKIRTDFSFILGHAK